AGMDKVAEIALRYGIGVELGVGIPGEKTGLVPSRQWKQASFGQGWQQGETLIFGIGQGYILATPLQLAVMTARLANGGFAVVPRLLREASAPDGKAKPFPRLKTSPEHVRQVLAGMDAVTNSQRGTAYGAR